jgi:hypothetical protein
VDLFLSSGEGGDGTYSIWSLGKSELQSRDNPCQIHMAIKSPETRLIWLMITRKYAIEIVIEHAYTWN